MDDDPTVFGDFLEALYSDGVPQAKTPTLTQLFLQYAVADKYLAHTVKRSIVDRVENMLKAEPPGMERVCELATAVWKVTAGRNDPLRGIIRGYLQLLEKDFWKPAFSKACSECPEIAADLLHFQGLRFKALEEAETDFSIPPEGDEDW